MTQAVKTVSKSALVPYTPEQVFAVVTNVKDYPKFLPWCGASDVLEQSDLGMRASITMRLAGFDYAFATKNTHRAPHEIRLQLDKGVAGLAGRAFDSLHGAWTFTPLGKNPAKPQGCKIALSLEYAFASSVVGAVLSPLFDPIASTLVDSFVSRAESLYG